MHLTKLFDAFLEYLPLYLSYFYHSVYFIPHITTYCPSQRLQFAGGKEGTGDTVIALALCILRQLHNNLSACSSGNHLRQLAYADIGVWVGNVICLA